MHIHHEDVVQEAWLELRRADRQRLAAHFRGCSSVETVGLVVLRKSLLYLDSFSRPTDLCSRLCSFWRDSGTICTPFAGLHCHPVAQDSTAKSTGRHRAACASRLRTDHRRGCMVGRGGNVPLADRTNGALRSRGKFLEKFGVIFYLWPQRFRVYRPLSDWVTKPSGVNAIAPMLSLR